MTTVARWQSLLGCGAEDVRAVLLDAVGTLIAPDPPVREAYWAHGQRHGSRRSVEDVAQRFPAALAASSDPNGRTDEAFERARWRKIVQRVFDDVPDVEPLFAELWSHFATPTCWRLTEGAQGLCAELQTEGYVVGVASNFDARLRSVLQERLPGASLFISSELGWQKPHEPYFRAIEEQLRLSPSELLLIGDDWENDVLGARRAGWQAIWLSDRAETVDIPRVGSLRELLRDG